MSLNSAFYTRSIADADILATVSTRVYPDLAPESAAMPYMVYTVISTSHEHVLSGGAGMAHARVQVDCYASTRIAVLALAEHVRDAWQGYRGTADSVVIRSVVLPGDTQMIEWPIDGSEDARYRVTQDYMVWYAESIPAPA